MRAKSSTIENKVYKYVIGNPVEIRFNLIDREFENSWLTISDGVIKIKATIDRPYAWDGCSPKWERYDLIIGTPDGRLDWRTLEPITYYASMIHDVLCQFINCKGFPISRIEADIIFRELLNLSGFKLTKIYYFAVRFYAKLYGIDKVNFNHKVTDIKIEYTSWDDKNIE